LRIAWAHEQIREQPRCVCSIKPSIDMRDVRPYMRPVTSPAVARTPTANPRRNIRRSSRTGKTMPPIDAPANAAGKDAGRRKYKGVPLVMMPIARPRRRVKWCAAAPRAGRNVRARPSPMPAGHVNGA
jgi:hypothetical protein